ncbi:Cation efflux system protein CusC [wastewater metagenome]|uniref:Cation efflux system protein CusC n=3 Tax=root TaxID=1 RepID=A0A5B8RBM2_9ZZZZ|nr:cation efflux system protein CusC [uncultured organism]
MTSSLPLRLVLAGAGIAVLAACTPNTDMPARDAAPVPERFSASGDGALPSRWWRHFDDPALAALEREALAGSFSLAGARARLRRARALARLEGAGQRPQLQASSGARTQRNDGESTERYTGSLTASFEVDLWGRLASQARAAGLEAQASRFDLRAAAVTLSAEVARTYYQLLSQHETIELLRRQRDLNARIADLIEVRFRNGQVTADELLRQRQLTEQTGTTLEQALGERDRLRADLAALLGRPPQALALPTEAPERVVVPPLPDVGVPSAWLRRRPDLRAAFLRVRSADATVAASIAERYPSLDLSASLTSTAVSAARAFEDWVRELAASLTLPLYQGGAISARIERDRAARAVAFNDYAQTVVEAVAEVEQALSAARADRRVLDGLQRQRDIAERVLTQLRSRYFNGAADYLDVLDAQSRLQDIERQLVDARWALVLDRIALIRAVAGGAFGEPTDEGDEPT